MWKLLTVVSAVVVIMAGVAFTSSGHRLLHTLGFTAARAVRTAAIDRPNFIKGKPMSNSQKLWTFAVALVIIAVTMGFTSPGHRLLYRLGFTAACSSDDCGGN